MRKLPLQRQLEDYDPEEVIPPGLLGEDPQAPESFSLEDEEPEGFDAILRPPSEAPTPLRHSAPVRGGLSPRPALRRMGPSPRDEYAAASASDADAQRMAKFEAGLDTAAFRKPIQARNVGTPAQDALTKRLGMERQGKQDDMAAFLNDAKVKDYLSRGAREKEKLSTTQMVAEARQKAAMEKEQRERGYKAQDTAAANAFTLGRDKASDAAAMARQRVAAQAASGAKEAAAAQGTTVPGLEVSPGAAPTPDDAKKVKTTLDAAGRLKPLVQQLRALHGDKGTELFGADANKMSQIVTAIKLEAKTIAELGALSGPDLDLMNQLSGMDPTTFSANIKAMFGVDNTQEALAQLDTWMENAVKSKKDTYGYRDAPKPETGVPGGLTPEEEARLEALEAKARARQ
jgi:hypothetical protein